MQRLKNTWCVLQCSVGVPLPIRADQVMADYLSHCCKDRREDARKIICFKSYSGELWTQRSLKEFSSRREEIFVVSKAQKSLLSFVSVSSWVFALLGRRWYLPKQRGFRGRGDTMEVRICQSLNCRAGSPRLTTLSLGILLIKALK